MIQYNIRTLGKNEWDFLELVTFGLHMKPVSTERLHLLFMNNRVIKNVMNNYI